MLGIFHSFLSRLLVTSLATVC